MEENMNEEALAADGQKDDDIDYVEDREELTEDVLRICWMPGNIKN